MGHTGILLVNTGSPDSPEVADVRRYLRQFLMDERVLDSPAPLRRLIVSGFILPFRPKRSAAAYQSIWWEEGSPLVVLSQRLRHAVQAELDAPVELGMRYGNPSIDTAVQSLAASGVAEILLIALFPHYAMSTVQSIAEKAKRAVARLGPGVTLRMLPLFYNDPLYIDALVASAAPYLAQDYDHLLFSYHGLPERHLRKTDPTGRHCLSVAGCCAMPTPVHATCYRHQVLKTTALFVQRAGISVDRHSVAFQSRLGRDKWLQPATTQELERLAASGVRRLLVICPAFVTDCIETLEEIDQAGRELFLRAGGHSFTLIPALNTHPAWVAALARWCQEALDSAPATVTTDLRISVQHS
jgi:ferrochelatase